MIDDTYEYGYVYEIPNLNKFDIFICWFWLMLGLGSLLTGVTFIVLKLFEIISWAWWVILSPLWGFIGLIALIICFIVVGVWVSELIVGIKCHKKYRKEKDQK